jgi:hypothetical protein
VLGIEALAKKDMQIREQSKTYTAYNGPRKSRRRIIELIEA